MLVLSADDDEHVPFLSPHFAARRVDVVRFDPAAYPSRAGLTIELGPRGARVPVLRLDGTEHDLSGLTGVWLRRPGDPTPDEDVRDETHRRFVRLVSQRFLDGLWELLPGCWLPARPSVERRADNKLLQLDLAAEIGFDVPHTWVTNEPLEFLRIAESGKPLVSKSLVNTDVLRGGTPHVVLYTHPLRRRDTFNYPLVRYAPVIFQEYVPKAVELRVIVVAAQVFAVEIASQQSRTTRHDWRRYDDPSVRYSAHELPNDVADKCIEIVRRLGLCFGALDLVLTPDGRYVFLEVNGNGQWGFVELRTGLPIGAAIADVLTGSACSTR